MVADYYVELGVGQNASPEEIRSAYRKQAVRWHPDKLRKVPLELAEETKKKFQKIQEAYSVLSDGRKRRFYNAGLCHASEEVDEGLCDFVEELSSLMVEVRRERTYGLGELENMLSEMMAGGNCCSGSTGGGCRSSKRARVGVHGCRDCSAQESAYHPSCEGSEASGTFYTSRYFRFFSTQRRQPRCISTGQ